jgi:hypothetical protein
MANITLNIPGSFTAAAALNGGTVSLKENSVHLDKLNEFEMIVLEEN